MKILAARTLAASCIALAAAGCVVYDPYYHPHPHVSHDQAMDRYWGAALAAMRDQGLEIVREDRVAGVIQGRRGGITVGARVAAQADGRYRVEFNAGGNLAEDPSLPDRVSRAYDARLGR